MRAVFRCLLIAGLGVTLLSGVASASFFNLRPVPVLNGASLQAFLNGLGNSINVNTDQSNAAIWATTSTGVSSFTLVLELAGNASSNRFGIYNYGTPAASFEVFGGAASVGWSAHATFNAGGVAGDLSVSRFNSGLYVDTQLYHGVNSSSFGFWLGTPGGTFYSEDDKNPNNGPQNLVYAGTGANAGEWYLAWEDIQYGNSDKDFNDMVVAAQSINPVPEPGTLLLLSAGLLTGGLLRRRRG